MPRLQLGVHLDAFGLALRPALAAAQQLGVAGGSFHALGQLSAPQLTQTGRRDLKRLFGVNSLTVAAVSCPLRQSLSDADQLDLRLDYVKQTMALSFDLEARRVLLQAGQIPGDDDPRLAILRDALRELAAHGDRTGVTIALESGLEAGESLAKFLAGFDTASLGVNFDPANQLLNGFRPLEDARALAGMVQYVQAKDARRHTANRAAQEVPLGHGDLDWLQLLAVFEEIDYHGWIVVQREGGQRGPNDVQQGVQFLRRLLG